MPYLRNHDHHEFLLVDLHFAYRLIIVENLARVDQLLMLGWIIDRAFLLLNLLFDHFHLKQTNRSVKQESDLE